jgi:hypothetical protein
MNSTPHQRITGSQHEEFAHFFAKICRNKTKIAIKILQEFSKPFHFYGFARRVKMLWVKRIGPWA